LKDFVSIVAEKMQQYRQNHMYLVSLTTGYTRGYKDFTLPDTMVNYKLFHYIF